MTAILAILLVVIIVLLVVVIAKLSTVGQQGETIMATITQVRDDFQQFVTDVQAAIAALQAQLAAGGAVEAGDLDALKSQIDAADAALKAPAA